MASCSSISFCRSAFSSSSIFLMASWNGIGTANCLIYRHRVASFSPFRAWQHRAVR